MSYVPNVQLDLGPAYTGMASTLRAQLYTGSTGATAGSEMSGGFTEMPGDEGQYIYRPTIPDGHEGWCRVYPDGLSTVTAGYFAINPVEMENSDVKTSLATDAIAALNNLSDTEAAAAIMAYLLVGSKSFESAFTDVWAVVAGNATANDGTNPTFIQYQNPATGGQIGHVLTDTTRVID